MLVTALLLVPAALLLYKSFKPSLGFGITGHGFTFDSYVSAVETPTYRKVAYNALGVGALAAIICTAMSYPVAFFINFRLRRGRDLALLLIVASLFSSYLVRLYAWRTILGDHGVINVGLESLGVLKAPLSFLLYSNWSVLIAFVNIFLPFTILIITSAVQNVPIEMLESSRDLGASSFKTFLKVLLPLTSAGAIGAFVYTFILATGDYITPQLLGGTSGGFIASVISDQFVVAGDQPLGAALCFLLLLVFAFLYVALTRVEKAKVA